MISGDGIDWGKESLRGDILRGGSRDKKEDVDDIIMLDHYLNIEGCLCDFWW